MGGGAGCGAQLSFNMNQHETKVIREAVEAMEWVLAELFLSGSMPLMHGMPTNPVTRSLSSLKSLLDQPTAPTETPASDTDAILEQTPIYDDAMRERLRVAAERADQEEPTDTEMLDWLEGNGHTLHVSCWHVSSAKENEWTIERGEFLEDDPIGRGKLLRSAVREAMKKATK